MLNCSHRYTSNIILGDCSHRYTSNVILDDCSHRYTSNIILDDCSHRYTSNIILDDCSHRYTSNIILDDYSWLFTIIRNIFLSWYQNLYLNFQEFENLKMAQVLAKSCSFISLPSDSLLLFYFSSVWLFVALLVLFRLTLYSFKSNLWQNPKPALVLKHKEIGNLYI